MIVISYKPLSNQDPFDLDEIIIDDYILKINFIV